MSENVVSESGQTVIPYVGIDRIAELLKAMYRSSLKEQKLEALATLMGCGISNLNNVTPSLAALGLGEVKRGVLTLTQDGLTCADAFFHDDPEKAKPIIRRNLQKSEALVFTKSLLETRSTLSGEEIGRALSDRFQKNWKNIQTIRGFGNSCATILAFAGFGYYYDGILSVQPPTIKSAVSLYAPEANYNELVNILQALHAFERAKLEEVAKKANQKESDSYQILTIASALALAEKLPNNIYRITYIGRKLIDPLLSVEDKQAAFRSSLIKSKYIDIIQKLAKSAKEFSLIELGNVLGFELQRNWNESTKEVYGKKFGNWLINSGLTEKTERGKYRVKNDLLQISTSEMETKDDKLQQSHADLKTIFEIGRTLGSLETIIHDADDKKLFEEKLAVLRGLIGDHDDLKLMLDMLSNNFELAKNANNPSVYQSNVLFVKNKIKEKVLGSGVS